MLDKGLLTCLVVLIGDQTTPEKKYPYDSWKYHTPSKTQAGYFNQTEPETGLDMDTNGLYKVTEVKVQNILQSWLVLLLFDLEYSNFVRTS
jgi:hypothetical protein